MRRWIHRALLVLALSAALLPTAGYAQQPDAPAASQGQQPGVATAGQAPQQDAAPFSQPPQPGTATTGQGQQPSAATASSAPPPDASAVLAAAALTEADVPAGLTFDERRSGPRPTEDGVQSYLATFVGNGRGDLPIMGVINILNTYPDPSVGIDRLTDRFRTGLGGTPTELDAPGIGEASRAFTVSTSAMGGAMTASTVFVAIRRAGVVAGVAVTSMGATPQTEVALRLAQSVDRRLAAALRPGT
jgi:hypothetical protein